MCSDAPRSPASQCSALSGRLPCGRLAIWTPITPSRTPSPSVWLSFRVMPSMRSAAELNALTTRGLRRLGAVGGRHRGLLQMRRAPPPAGACVWPASQLVRHRQRRHHGEPGVADLAEARAQLRDAVIEIRGELQQMLLLPVLAGHAELAAVDGDVHLRHRIPHVGLRRASSTGWMRVRSPRRAGARSRGWWSPACASARSAPSSSAASRERSMPSAALARRARPRRGRPRRRRSTAASSASSARPDAGWRRRSRSDPSSARILGHSSAPIPINLAARQAFRSEPYVLRDRSVNACRRDMPCCFCSACAWRRSSTARRIGLACLACYPSPTGHAFP